MRKRHKTALYRRKSSKAKEPFSTVDKSEKLFKIGCYAFGSVFYIVKILELIISIS
ncbi:MAG: hypothetical protein FWG65_11755 [Turicibacter sp.]|nr:hypothetical protein [Turicibacter sp.]